MSDNEQLMELYTQLLVLRHFDEFCYDLKMKDLIMNGFHPYSGQEAVAVGVCSLLREDDAVFSTHRPQGHSIAKGSSTRAVFCEMLGRRGGVSQGIGGPMQWIDKPHNFFCGSIVGSGLPIAAGVALAFKRQARDSVAVCFFGDGASNTGAFHEGMNLAAIWKLPALYICENNQYGEAMPVQEFVPVSRISQRATSYGLNGVSVDGMDVEAVMNATADALEQLRAGQGPVFIEMVTYRFRGHYGGDPEHTYRSREEIAVWRNRDPLTLARTRLLARGYSEETLDDLEASVRAEIEEDMEWALEQPFPTVEQATDHVMIPLGQD
ncbi:MAG: thiamine pyrophosphate-dependent dehydrogenase E1 component subunit alpha [Anaerolineaceae bacterium]|nr:thiamine pyrophosphate-dependent dehydrogenase E1 component subunit alpha [Anaerolineaceae bacterium]MDD9955163.1 thiamine pyrophosphate-dependent dehydrogenase E1 component subunit alpha [Anaerolineaceae bacterium]MDE0328026.1 thiamine pyrophosphate-dependent dehydrogenase E1 component subunit alpha [Anaerolineaceae bacterium]